MTYKTILVHVDGSARALERMRVAAELSDIGGGHVIGAAPIGISRYMFKTDATSHSPEYAGPFVDEQARRLRERAKRELDNFDARMREAGVASFEARLVEDENFGGLTLQARYADVTVLTQFDPFEPAGGVYAALPETVAMASGRPVLVLPFAGSGKWRAAGGNVMAAWDGSTEAARAIHHALPLMQAARETRLVVFNAENTHGLHGAEPGADIALYLARHGIKVEVERDSTRTDIGDALISLCAQNRTDVLVTGCYGHSRFHEILLGGVSRTILSSATVPVFMVH